MVFWVGSGVAILATIAILIILCCCCCGGKDKNQPQPGQILHTQGMDHKLGRVEQFSSGRHVVTPAKSQLTQSTFTPTQEDAYQHTDSYYSMQGQRQQHDSMPQKFNLEDTLTQTQTPTNYGYGTGQG